MQHPISIPVDPATDLPTLLQHADLQPPQPTLVLIGGASKMTDESSDRLHHLFQTLVP